MIKYKTKKEIIEILNDKMFMDFDYNKRTTKPLTDNDIYIIKGWIFVNMTPTKSVYKYSGIDVYKYPLNEFYGTFIISHLKIILIMKLILAGIVQQKKTPLKLSINLKYWKGGNNG